MLRVDLGDLERTHTVGIDGCIDPDEQCFQDSSFLLYGPLELILTASWVGLSTIVVCGRCRGTVQQDCRRCLDPVKHPLDTEITLVFALVDSLEEKDTETIGLDPRAQEIDLIPYLRDEVILEVPSFVECSVECRGLCAGCGKNLNTSECKCLSSGMDPRWDALRALQTE